MKLNDLKSTYESRIAKVNRWLEETYGFKVFDKVAIEKLYATREALDKQREELKMSLPFNSYHENPQYAKNILLSEAIVLMIGQIDDEEMRRKPDDDNEDGEDSPLSDVNIDGQVPASESKQSVKEDGGLEQAETVLASKNLVDALQSMIEDLGKMQNDDLGAIVDQMQQQFGADKASSFNGNVNEIIDNLLNAAREAKESVNNEVLILQGEAPATGSTGMTDPEADVSSMDDDSLEIEEPADSDIASDGDDAASGPLDEPLGRAKKA